MQEGERQSGKKPTQIDAPYLLNHKTSWLLEEDIEYSYLKTYLLSNSQEGVIKIEVLEDETDEFSILTSDKNIGFIKKENQVLKQFSELIKGFICDVCGKLFAYKSLFNRHMLIHSREKTFSCKLCEKAFTLKITLNTHMVIHSGKKAFSCNLCEKAFSLKGILDRHMLIQ